jgi:hypothetical protein
MYTIAQEKIMAMEMGLDILLAWNDFKDRALELFRAMRKSGNALHITIRLVINLIAREGSGKTNARPTINRTTSAMRPGAAGAPGHSLAYPDSAIDSGSAVRLLFLAVLLQLILGLARVPVLGLIVILAVPALSAGILQAFWLVAAGKRVTVSVLFAGFAGVKTGVSWPWSHPVRGGYLVCFPDAVRQPGPAFCGIAGADRAGGGRCDK